MEDEDTWVGGPPRPDGLTAATADTGEWDDTDREVEAQGTLDTTPQAFEDTGVVIIDKPVEPASTDRFVVTFRRPSAVRFRAPVRFVRASTADQWPPPPREPAPPRRAAKHAGVYASVARPETKN